MKTPSPRPTSAPLNEIELDAIQGGFCFPPAYNELPGAFGCASGIFLSPR